MTKHTQKDAELERLRKQLAEGQEKVRTAEAKAGIEIEKSKIRKQLILLKHPKKIALARRLGRGFKITAGKTGKALIKQGRLIATQQERDRRLEVAREKMFGKKVKVRKSKKKKRVGSNNQMFDLTRLDF